MFSYTILSCHILCICVFVFLYSCTIHFIYCFPIILFILHFHTCIIVYFIYICTFLFYLSYTLCFCILSVLFFCLYTYFHIKLYCTSCSCNCLYFHRIARLCFSYHVISYTFHIHFLCVYFSFSFIFMPANTLEADSGNNWVYPKALSLYKTVISVYVYPKVLSLYETVISVYCGDPFGATVI